MAKEVNAETWEKDVVKSDKPVVVDFWHEQCIWCQRLNPVYEELSKGYDKAVLAKLDVRASNSNMNIAAKYGIMSTPTMKVFCNGRIVGELMGFMEKEELKNGIDKILEKSENCLEKSSELK